MFLNLLPSHSNPLLLMISVDQGYLSRHLLSTNFSSFVDFLSFYCIIVTDFNINGDPPFLCIFRIPIKSAQSLFQVFYSANLGLKLSCLVLTLYLYVMSHIVWLTFVWRLLFRASKKITNCCIRSIQNSMKDICMSSLYYLSL